MEIHPEACTGHGSKATNNEAALRSNDERRDRNLSNEAYI